MKNTIRGFRPVTEKALPEIGAVAHEMEHEKTGAKLLWLERPEENKTFGIAFTTLPFDDTGVFHILEHSVLCGSDRYPVKEPFVELLKNSMNTFLNAMTFPDKTFYPVSSRNSQDFVNLMRVYLDAVFHPAIYHKPEIFRQEGWHYEFAEDGTPSYKGVVFNEMKGAFAGADELLMNAMFKALFPRSPYRFVSGGDPAAIPDLTYDSFIGSHQKFYSPSNSFIFLDGDLDIDGVLAIIDGEYLSAFPRGERIAPPAEQEAVDGGTVEVLYELSPDEEEKGRTRIAWGNVIGSYDQQEKLVGAQVLSQVLCGNNQAPLRRAILSQGLAENVSLDVIDDMMQPMLALEVRNLDADSRETVEKVIFGELERLAAEGLDAEQVESVLANLEFRARERDFGSMPTGLIFGMQALSTWLYGGEPEEGILVGDLYERLREMGKKGYFEQLIRELLLDNPHRCQIILTPSHTAGEARRGLEQQRLARESAAWDGAQKQKLMDQQQVLMAWQASEDTPEQLATLPHLALSDISDAVEELPLEEKTLAGIGVLCHEVSSSGIVYMSLYFDAGDCGEEELSRLSLLGTILGKAETEHYTAQALANRLRLLCGYFRFGVSGYSVPGDVNDTRVKFVCSFSTLESNVDAALELVTEILTATRLSDEKTVLDILRQQKTALFQQAVMGGHAMAMSRLSAQCTASGVVSERTGGISYYQWLKDREANWSWSEMQAALTELAGRIIGKGRLTLSVTASGMATAQAAAKLLADRLPEGAAPAEKARLKPWGLKKEGIIIPADISFAVRGGNLAAQGSAYSGHMQLASRIVGLAYLWNVIRVQGGAYGAGLVASPNGQTACYSYRDPNGAQSLQRYAEAAGFLRQFASSGADLTGFIIGAVSDDSPLRTPRLVGSTADTWYWQGITPAGRREVRHQLLNAAAEDLLAVADTLERVMAEGGICIVGGVDCVNACEGLENVISL